MKLVLDEPGVADRLHQLFGTWQDRKGRVTNDDASELKANYQYPLLGLLLGKDVECVGGYCEERITTWLDIVEQWDWTKSEIIRSSQHRNTIKRASQAGRDITVFAPHEPPSDYFLVEERRPSFPYALTNELAMLLSLLFRRYDLFERLGAAHLHVDQTGSGSFSLNRFLIHLACGRTEMLAQELARHSGRYSRDAANKPQYRELLASLLEEDEQLLHAGLAKDYAKHNLMWSCKRYAAGPVRTRGFWKTVRYDSHSHLLAAVAEDLAHFGWSQAYLSGAAISYWQRYVNPALEVSETRWVQLIQE